LKFRLFALALAAGAGLAGSVPAQAATRITRYYIPPPDYRAPIAARLTIDAQYARQTRDQLDPVVAANAAESGRVLAEYRPQTVWSPPLDAVQIVSLRYGQARNPFTLEKGEAEGWQAVGKPGVKLNESTVNDTLAALAGQVEAARPAGADVVALDQNGFVPVAVLTERDGSFKLPSLPPGDYSVYVEPLVGAFTRQGQLSSAYYNGLRTNFLTRFAGDANTPPYHVTAGDTTTIDAITVAAGTPALLPTLIVASPDGSPTVAFGGAMVVAAGSSGYLTVVGPGLDATTEIGVTGSDVTLDPSSADVGSWNTGTSYVTVPFAVRVRRA